MMKSLKILIVMTMMGTIAYGQSGPVKVDTPLILHFHCKSTITFSPLYILIRKGKQYSIDSAVFKKSILNPNVIKSMNVMRGQEALTKYGASAKNGVVLITLEEDKHSSSFKELKKYLVVLQSPGS